MKKKRIMKIVKQMLMHLGTLYENLILVVLHLLFTSICVYICVNSPTIVCFWRNFTAHLASTSPSTFTKRVIMSTTSWVSATPQC